MRWLGGAFAAGAMLAVPPAQAQIERAQLVALSASLVKIEASGERGYSLGSGIIVAPETVATNCHVTRRALGVQVAQRGLRRAASAQAADVAHDLCILRVPDLQGPPAVLSDGPALKRGDALIAIGYGGGLELRASVGALVSRHRLDGGMVLRSSTPFVSGASGGGLFDREGRLLGILTFRLRGGEAHYFSIPVAWIAAQAQQARFAPIEPLQGQTFWERDRDARPAFLRAAELGERRDWPELVQLAERWQREDPADPEAASTLAEALAQVGNADGAQRAMVRSVALAPEDADRWLQLGMLQTRAGHAADAEFALDRWRQLEPTRGMQLRGMPEIP